MLLTYTVQSYLHRRRRRRRRQDGLSDTDYTRYATQS